MSETDLTVLILAGGAGRRMGGIDKGLLEWQGRPLIAHLLEQIRDYPGDRLISCNRHREQYRHYAPIVSDKLPDFQGPLAGIAAGLQRSTSRRVLVLPCDNPTPPPDCYDRLRSALNHTEAGIAYAHDGSRGQYLSALIDRACLPSLLQYLERGERSVYRWYQQVGARAVDFSDCEKGFDNFNRKDDMAP